MSCRILVTDDDELVLIAVEGLLVSEGFDVMTATNGPEALEKAAAESFELFLLDIIMPGMSGFEVCEKLRAMPAYAQTPIVMLTAKSAEADRKRGLEIGATRFLPKPIDPKELVRILKDVTA